uniref:Mirror-image polydactyly 1 n=1 Tax=Oncorhynchus tshawytscha TaxID=74940 RepID=A0AAZ3SX12_ONCTS
MRYELNTQDRFVCGRGQWRRVHVCRTSAGKLVYVTGNMCRKSCFSESEEERSLSWTHSKELKDSLVDMYKANPKVNEELKQRLPSPVRHQRSETTLPQLGADLGAILGTTSNQLVLEEPDKDWPQVPQYFRPIEEESRTSRSPSPQAHHRRSPSPQAHHRAPDTGRRMEEERTSSRSPFTQDGYRSEGHSQGSNGSPPVYRRHLVPPDSSQALQSSIKEDQGNIKVSSSSFDSKKQSLVLDKEKNIAFLLKELDSLRELNKKLQDKLAMREKELESRLVDAELMQTQLDARACEKAGALVEEIYQAQRDRDQAVMARLRLANEERDEALLRAKRLQQAVADLENINPEESDADLEELLNRVNSADSALGIERSGGDRGPAAEGPGEKEEDYSRGDECCYRGERDSTGQVQAAGAGSPTGERAEPDFSKQLETPDCRKQSRAFSEVLPGGRRGGPERERQGPGAHSTAGGGNTNTANVPQLAPSPV